MAKYSGAPQGAVFPLCFKSRRDYEGWHEQAWKVAFKEPAPLAHCEDCTPEYQRRMLDQGRCSNPGAHFGIFA